MLRRYRLLKHYYHYIIPLLVEHLQAEKHQIDECLQVMFLPDRNEPPLLQSDIELEEYIQQCLQFIRQEFEAEPYAP
jgi:hypothetical protein